MPGIDLVLARGAVLVDLDDMFGAFGEDGKINLRGVPSGGAAESARLVGATSVG